MDVADGAFYDHNAWVRPSMATRHEQSLSKRSLHQHRKNQDGHSRPTQNSLHVTHFTVVAGEIRHAHY